MKQQKLKNSNVPLCRIFLALILLFWLSAHVDIATALCQGLVDVSNRPLLIFIFMNFIIFVLCFLSSPKQIQPPNHAVYHDNGGSYRNSPDVVDSLPEEGCAEEIFEDKHIILVENAVGEIVAVSSDDDSESFERNHHQLQFRRLERGMSKELVITMREPPWRSSMNDMSNEEFRFAVEAFIAEKNQVMMQENIHDEEGIHFVICTSD